MKIDDKRIKFTFYLDGNKYIVFSFNENIEMGDELYFAKEIEKDIYDSIGDDEYNKVINEYMDYLQAVGEDDLYED